MTFVLHSLLILYARIYVNTVHIYIEIFLYWIYVDQSDRWYIFTLRWTFNDIFHWCISLFLSAMLTRNRSPRSYVFFLSKSNEIYSSTFTLNTNRNETKSSAMYKYVECVLFSIQRVKINWENWNGKQFSVARTNTNTCTATIILYTYNV